MRTVPNYITQLAVVKEFENGSRICSFFGEINQHNAKTGLPQNTTVRFFFFVTPQDGCPDQSVNQSFRSIRPSTVPLLSSYLLCQLPVHGRGVVLADALLHGEDLGPQGLCPEADLDHVAGSDLRGGLGRAAVDADPAPVAGLLRHGPALDQPRDLQPLVQAHIRNIS